MTPITDGPQALALARNNPCTTKAMGFQSHSFSLQSSKEASSFDHSEELPLGALSARQSGLDCSYPLFAGPHATYKFGMQPLSKATNPARCPPPEANRPERAPGALLLRALSLIMENNPVLTEWLVSVAASPFRVRCIRLRLWPHRLEGGR
jgi:hypothetical protein